MGAQIESLFEKSQDVDLKIWEKLMKAIADKQSQNFDYLKFRLSYRELERMGMDHEISVKSAFVTAKALGIEKPKLLDSLNTFKDVLAHEKQEFALALKHQIAKHVDAKIIDIQQMKNKIIENEKKIESLYSEIELIRQKSIDVEQQIKEATEKINSTRDAFQKTIDVIKDAFDSDEKTITEVL